MSPWDFVRSLFSDQWSLGGGAPGPRISRYTLELLSAATQKDAYRAVVVGIGQSCATEIRRLNSTFRDTEGFGSFLYTDSSTTRATAVIFSAVRTSAVVVILKSEETPTAIDLAHSLADAARQSGAIVLVLVVTEQGENSLQRVERPQASYPTCVIGAASFYAPLSGEHDSITGASALAKALRLTLVQDFVKLATQEEVADSDLIDIKTMLRSPTLSLGVGIAESGRRGDIALRRALDSLRDQGCEPQNWSMGLALVAVSSEPIDEVLSRVRRELEVAIKVATARHVKIITDEHMGSIVRVSIMVKDQYI